MRNQGITDEKALYESMRDVRLPTLSDESKIDCGKKSRKKGSGLRLAGDDADRELKSPKDAKTKNTKKKHSDPSIPTSRDSEEHITGEKLFAKEDLNSPSPPVTRKRRVLRRSTRDKIDAGSDAPSSKIDYTNPRHRGRRKGRRSPSRSRSCSSSVSPSPLSASSSLSGPREARSRVRRGSRERLLSTAKAPEERLGSASDHHGPQRGGRRRSTSDSSFILPSAEEAYDQTEPRTPAHNTAKVSTGLRASALRFPSDAVGQALVASVAGYKGREGTPVALSIPVREDTEGELRLFHEESSSALPRPKWFQRLPTPAASIDDLPFAVAAAHAATVESRSEQQRSSRVHTTELLPPHATVPLPSFIDASALARECSDRSMASLSIASPVPGSGPAMEHSASSSPTSTWEDVSHPTHTASNGSSASLDASSWEGSIDPSWRRFVCRNDSVFVRVFI